MTKQQLIWNAGPAADIEIRGARKTSSFQLAENGIRHRPIGISFPARRREPCLTRRAMLVALRAAELAHWMASGGDYLASMHQPVA